MKRWLSAEDCQSCTDPDEQEFIDSIKSKLDETSGRYLEVPAGIEGMFVMEDVAISFDEQRYVITDEASAVVKQVIDIYHTNKTLESFGIRYLNSLLFFGSSGCGKTMLGKYIALKAGIPFGYLNFTRLLSCYLGQTGKNLEQVFNYVKNHKCVLMLDEIDAIGISRGTVNEVGELSRICINLMQQLDIFDSGNILIGATNRIQDIDEALGRRFSLQYEVKLPDTELRKAIAKRYLDTIPEACYTEESLSRFAAETDKESCALITNRIVNGIVQCLVNKTAIDLAYI